MTDLKVYKRVYEPFLAFRNRSDAGLRLAEFFYPAPQENSIVLALPRGGVPVAEPLAHSLGARLDLVLVRKLPLPHNPEAGFGAVTIDGTRVLNDPMVERFGISSNEIERVTAHVTEEVRRRAREYTGSEHVPDVGGLHAYLVDDGLATGYTAVAAAMMLRKRGPRSLTLCVPVSPWDTLLTVGPHFDRIRVLFVQERSPFAVASFYEDFHDFTDAEVRAILTRTSRATDTPSP